MIHSSRDGGKDRMSPKSRLAYMAGLMDGEGSFSISVIENEKGGKHFAANIRFYNTNRKLISWVIDNFGGTPSWGNKNGGNIQNQKTRKRMCQWFLTSRQSMESFLLQMIPYLIAKKQQANLMLQFVRLNGTHDPEQRQKIADEVSALNLS